MNTKRLIYIVGFAIIFSMIEKIIPQIIYRMFAYPAGYLSALFMGKHFIVSGPGEIFIQMARRVIHITPTCGAFKYFCLLYVFVVSYFRPFDLSKRFFMRVLGALPICYLITVFTNVARIVVGYYIDELARVFLPSNFYSVLHLGVGYALFIAVLTIVSLFLENKYVKKNFVNHLIKIFNL